MKGRMVDGWRVVLETGVEYALFVPSRCLVDAAIHETHPSHPTPHASSPSIYFTSQPAYHPPKNSTGNLLQLFNSKGLWFHHDLTRKYGDVVKIWGFFGVSSFTFMRGVFFSLLTPVLLSPLSTSLLLTLLTSLVFSDVCVWAEKTGRTTVHIRPESTTAYYSERPRCL